MESNATVPTTKTLIVTAPRCNFEIRNFHRYLPIIGPSSVRIFFGIRDGSVIIAFFSDDAQAHERKSDNDGTTRLMVSCANATFWANTFSTCSISTSPAVWFQQS